MSALVVGEKIVVNSEGNPLEVIIPYAQFVEMKDVIERNLLDFDEVELAELREAIADSEAGNREAFVPADQV